MKSINEYISTNELPNISVSEYKKICAQLGITIKDKDQKISEEDFIKLKNDVKINKYMFQQKAKDLYNETRVNYDEIIKEAKAQKLASGRKGFSNEKAIMEQKVQEIKDLMDKSKNSFNNRTETTIVDENLLNEYQKNRYSNLNERIDKVDSILKKKYAEQLQLKSALNKSRTGFKKAVTQGRLNRINKSISRLQQKQGRLMGEQRKIAEVAARKYKAIRTMQIEEYKRSITTSKNYVNAIEKLNQSHKDVVNDISLTTAELANPSLGKFKKASLKIDKAKLEMEKAKLEREKARIEKLRQMQTKLDSLRRKAPAMGTEVALNRRAIAYA